MLEVTDLLSRNLCKVIKEVLNQNSTLEYEQTHKLISSLHPECSVRQRELHAQPRVWVNVLAVVAAERCLLLEKR